MNSVMHLLLFVGLLVWMSGHEVSCTRRIRKRSVEAYGMPKAHRIRDQAYIDSIGENKKSVTMPENDKTIGVIEIVDKSPPSEQFDFTSKSKRSIDGGYIAWRTNDLGTEEAEIFRPLFFLKQQMANQQLLRSDGKKRINFEPNFKPKLL